MVASSKLSVSLLGFTAGVAAVAVAIRAAGDRATSSGGSGSGSGGAAGGKAGGGKGKEHGGKEKDKDKVAVDATFVKRLKVLLKICIPSLATPEAGYAAAVALAMVARTACDVWMISAQTRIESSIISRNTEGFVTHLTRFVGGMVPIALVNNILKYCLAELHMRFRTRLTRHILASYLQRNVFYLLTNIDGRIANPDQLIAQDVDRFTSCLVDLYSNLTKPILDIALYAYRLGNAIGVGGPGTMMLYLLVSGAALTWLRKPVAKLTVREQQLEGEFRYVNSRLITSAEEVAFYAGGEKEKASLLSAFNKMMRHIRVSQQYRYSVGVVDTLVAKYLATVVGFWVVSRPVRSPAAASWCCVGSRCAPGLPSPPAAHTQHCARATTTNFFSESSNQVLSWLCMHDLTLTATWMRRRQ